MKARWVLLVIVAAALLGGALLFMRGRDGDDRDNRRGDAEGTSPAKKKNKVPYALTRVGRARGAGLNKGLSVAVAADGSVLLTGGFRETVTFSPGEDNEVTLTSVGETDIFLARYDSRGRLAWGKRAGGAEYDQGMAVAALPDGSALAAGSFWAPAPFAPGEKNETPLTGEDGLFLARYNPDGGLAWVRRTEEGDEDKLLSVAALSNGAALVAGNLMMDGAFLARYDAEGGLAWVRTLGGDGTVEVSSLAVLPDDSAFVTGGFDGAAVFNFNGPGATQLTATGRDAFLARYAPDGRLVWVRRAGSPDEAFGFSVAALPDGSALVTGSFDGAVTFAPGEADERKITASPRKGVFLARYTPDGSLAWARRVGDNGVWIRTFVGGTSDGSALLLGARVKAATFGAGEANEATITTAKESLFLARYAADGKLVRVRDVGGWFGDEGQTAAILPDGSVFMTNIFSTMADEETGEEAGEDAGIVLMRLDP